VLTRSTALALTLSLCPTHRARADDQASPRPPPVEPPPAYVTVVTATTPMHGSGRPRDQVPANVQVLDAEDLAGHHSLDLSAYLGEALGSVWVGIDSSR
jgi:hypothetical protein